MTVSRQPTAEMERAVLEVLEKNGAKEEPPQWAKLPDCPCFRVMPATRTARIDAAVFEATKQVATAMKESGVCADALWAFVGAMFYGVVVETRLAVLPNDEATFVVSDEEFKFMRSMIEAATAHALDRLNEIKLVSDEHRAGNA